MFSDRLTDFKSFWKTYLYDRNVFLSSLQQRFSKNDPEYEVINMDQYWSISIPHESSGPCYTYDPPFDSDPGFSSSMYLTMNSTDWDPDLRIFLHFKGKFFFVDDGSTADTAEINKSKLKAVTTGHPRISGKLYKSKCTDFNQFFY